MPRYLTHKEIDKSRWDQCIDNAASGNIYGYSWYLDVVCEGWDAIIEDDYSAVLPLAHRSKYFIDYIYPPFFAQQPGIFSVSDPDEKLCTAFLSTIPPKFQFIEMNLTIANHWAPDSFHRKSLPDYILNLNRPYELIRKSYSENHQRNLKKSAKNELSLFKAASAAEVIDMFRNNRGKQIRRLNAVHYQMFENLTQEALQRNCCNIWTVSDQYGVPCAGAVFFESHRKGYFIFSGLTTGGKELSAMHYLIDCYIQEKSETLLALDFEGSSDTDLARFYRGFGAIEFLYLQVKRNRLPIPWKWFKK